MTIYRKTEKGQQEIALGSKGTLERRYRFHLIMVDGVTEATELALRAPGQEDPLVVWATLLNAGLIEVVSSGGAIGAVKQPAVAMASSPTNAPINQSTAAPVIVPAVTATVAALSKAPSQATLNHEVPDTEIAALITRLKAAKREALSIAVPLYGPDANSFLAKVLKAGSEDELALAVRECGARLHVMAGKKISKNFVGQVLKHIGLSE